MKAKRREAGTMCLLVLLLVACTSQAVLVGGQEEYELRAPFPLTSHRPFALTYESVKTKECRDHSRTFLKDMKELKMWALKMHDATGKISSGVLRGNVHWMGDDMECFSVSSKPEAEAEDRDNIRGQYCSVSIFVEPIPKRTSANGDGLEDIYDLIHSHNGLRSNHHDKTGYFPSFSPLTIGVCIPHSCTAEDLKAGMMEWLMPSNSTLVDIKVQVTSEECLKDHRKNMHPMAIFTLTFFVMMTLIGFAGYFYEAKKKERIKRGETVGSEGKLTQVIMAFSFRSNMKDLLNSDVPMDEIGCLHGIRAFFSIIIYLLHKWFLSLHGPIANREDMVDMIAGPPSMIYRSFWSSVDTFVVMSGLLTSYYATKKLQEGKKLNILKMYLQRYIKFTPLYFVCVLWAANLFEYMVTDSHYVRTMRGYSDSCKDGWYNALTYTNVFKGINEMCYPQAHQLETDMQMYILAPFLVLLLWKLKLITVALILLSTIALSLYKYHIVIRDNLATIIYYGQTKQVMTDSANTLYMNFYHRLVPYMFGILMGYFLRVRNKEYKLPWLVLKIGNAVAIYSLYYNLFGMVHCAKPDYVYNAEENAMFGMIQPVAWACAISWFIYTCASGQAETFNRLLRWKGFVVTSRLSFAFYLSQIPAIMIQVGRNPTPSMYSLLNLFDLNCLAVTLIFTTWLTLLFLMPVGKLWNLFAGQAQDAGKETKNE